MQPIVLYSHPHGPNPWKVAIILEELKIPYETRFLNFREVKEEPYLSVNPNGRLPAIEDPNTGITMWESGAIVEYLIDNYDTSHTLTYASMDRYHLKTWLHFQASGQGPYYGQASWFTRFHPERIPSATERYANEIRRVTGVLEAALKDREWLVGDKCTYADLSFVPWQKWAPSYASDGHNMDRDFPRVAAWLARMHARPAVKKAMDDQDRAITEVEKTDARK